MTAIKTPPGGVRAARGFFWNRGTELRFIHFDPTSVSQLSLGLGTVAVAVNGFYKMHTAIAHRRFFGILASFLGTPYRPCAATRHQPSDAVIGAAQPHLAAFPAAQATAFLIRQAFRHFNQKPFPILFRI